MRDVIVAGLGAMGSAVAWRLARRGRRVLAFDRYAPPHPNGSSHGRTRIIREAYFEDPAYVPLVRRAYELWVETEQAAGERLMLRTRGLMVGPPDGEIVAGSLHSATTHGITHEMLDAAEIRRRFPMLRPTAGMAGLLEERAGILFAEAAVEAQLRLAAASGAELRLNEAVTGWHVEAGHVRVRTADGNDHEAERLVLAAGPWLAEWLRPHGVPLRCERQVMFWFSPAAGARFAPVDYPVVLWDDPGRPAFYTFPDLGDGVKVAIHHGGTDTEPDSVDRSPHPADETAVRDCLERYQPQANGELRDAAVCIYTNTPDGHFILDFLDPAKRVLVVSPCSGHGFKFASAIGEAAACLAADVPPPVDLSTFQLARFDHRRSPASLG